MELPKSKWDGQILDGEIAVLAESNSSLYVPVSVKENFIYKVTAEIKKESGNGLLYCNVYGGSREIDFPHVYFVCDSEDWKTYEVEVKTKSFSKKDKFFFRFWRPRDGDGTILIRKILFDLKGESPILAESKIEKKNTSVSLIVDNRKNTKYIKHYDENIGNKKVLFFLVNNEILQTGVESAFLKNGFQLCSFDFFNHHSEFGHESTQRIIIKLVNEYKPDWIHMILQFYDGFVDSKTISEIKKIIPNVIITNWSADVREKAIPYFIEIGKLIDKSLIPSEGQIDLYKKSGCLNVEYWQIGVDTNKFYRMSEDERENLRNKYKHDIVFVANRTGDRFPGGQLRDSVARILGEKFENNFGLYGAGWDNYASYNGRLDFYEQNNVYNGSKIIISINNFNNIRKYFSDRQLIAMATGTLTMSAYVPGLEEYFINHKDLVWFYNTYDLIDLINYYLKRPGKEKAIGKNGARKVKEEHSYCARVTELANRLGF
jgi:spore maturation protein CgeB